MPSPRDPDRADVPVRRTSAAAATGPFDGTADPAAMARLAAIVDSSDDAIIGTDLDGVITSWNAAACRIFGYVAEETIGMSIARLIPAERRDEARLVIARIRSGERVAPFEAVRRTKDGRLIDVSITVSPVRDRKGAMVGASAIMRDIGLLKRQEREIGRLSRLYSALGRINRTIVRRLDREHLLGEVCRCLVETAGFHTAWIGWNDPATHRLVAVARAGNAVDFIDSVKIYSDDRPEGRGPAGQAFRSGRSYICNDALNDPATEIWREQIRRHRVRAWAALPVHEGGRIVAVLVVYSREADYFQDGEVSLLTEVAGDISFALDDLAREAGARRAAEAVLHERTFSESMIDSMPGVVYFYDDKGRFLRWNRNFEAVSGYSGEEIARMHPLDFFADTDRALLQSRIAEVFRAGGAFVEAPFRTRDGRTIPYFFTGRRVELDGQTCLVGVGIDISERKRAEEAMQSSEARYRTLFEYAPDGILIADPRSVYLDANASMCRMLGYRREELIGLSAADILAPMEMEHVGSTLDDLNTRKDHHREWQFRRQDGSTFPADVIATAMPDGNIMAVVRDITDRKDAERAQRELNQTLERKVAERTVELAAAVDRAEHADRVKSAFLATMSHELRTPLNSIIGFTGIVLQGLAGPLNDEQAKQLGMVRGSARHLLALINDVLDISRIEAGQLVVRNERFDLAELIGRAAASIRPLAQQKGLSLEVEIPHGLGEMSGDARRLEQVLLNLLNNAVKFTERGGVALRAAIIGRPDAPAVEIEVRDTGIGIKPEDLEPIFEPFRQAESGITRQHEGTGLGLAICRRLATLMGGTIAATSQWRQGSSFVITLPLRRGAT